MEKLWTRASDMAGAPSVIAVNSRRWCENGGWSRHSGHRRPRFCSLRMDPSRRQGPLSSGRPPGAVPLKISMTTPRSRSVPRYATLARANPPLRITPFPRGGVSELAAEEAAVVTPEHGRLLTEQFGGCHRCASGERVQRLLAHGDHDARGRCGQRVDVGAIAADRP